MSLIKEALNLSNYQYREKFYPDKNSEKSKVPKPFCFAVVIPPDKQIIRETVFFNDKPVDIEVFTFSDKSFISFIVSSFIPEFIFYLYAGLKQIKDFQLFEDAELKIEKITLEHERQYFSDEEIFKTVSSILIENKDKVPLIPGECNMDEFNQEFNTIHDKLLKDIRGYGLLKPLVFVPIDIKKRIVKHTLQSYREKTGKLYMKLTCFEGKFMLKGAPHDLKTLYQTGIGLRRGQGFGLVKPL